MAIEMSRDAALRTVAEYLAKEMGPILDRVTRTCVTCEHWVDEKAAVKPNTCRLANALPPPRVIAYGCEKWEETIPF
jgi:hypothetical protein